MSDFDENENIDQGLSKILEDTKEEDNSDADAETHSKKQKNKHRKRKNSNNEWIPTDKEKSLMNVVFGNKKKLIENLQVSADIIKNESDVRRTENISKRHQVWNDSDDELNTNDIIDYEKKGAPVIKKSGKYKIYLENKFQNISGGAPAWADLNTRKEIDSDDEVLQSVGHIVKNKEKSLPATQLQYKHLKDLNRATYSEGPIITGIEFHPLSTVAFVTGKSGLATIYSIDGLKNDKLHGMEYKNYPIKCCRLSRDGTEAIIGSSKKFFYSYNLLTGQTQRIFLPKDITQMSKFVISPCGKYIAVAGRFGEIYLLSFSTKELLWTFKQEDLSTALAFGHDSNHLFSHSNSTEISIFDIKAQKLIHRFIDDGCINGSAIEISKCGKLIAAGSEQGVVNLYDSSTIYTKTIPAPRKTILNLTTKITDIKFNHSTEILAICSNEIKNAIKLCHFPSGTIFSNFLDPRSKIDKPNVIAFSPQSGYLAIGNMNKQVPLFRLKHYNNY